MYDPARDIFTSSDELAPQPDNEAATSDGMAYSAPVDKVNSSDLVDLPWHSWSDIKGPR